MTDKETLLTNTKKEVRAVLLPEKNGLPLPKFLKCYQNMIGKPLPFKEFGYQKAEQFLASIKDVVDMSWNNFNEIHLRAVADKSTQHIEKLVAKQKTSKAAAKIALSTSRRMKYKFGSYQSLFTHPRFQPPPFPYVKRSFLSQYPPVMPCTNGSLNSNVPKQLHKPSAIKQIKPGVMDTAKSNPVREYQINGDKESKTSVISEYKTNSVIESKSYLNKEKVNANVNEQFYTQDIKDSLRSSISKVSHPTMKINDNATELPLIPFQEVKSRIINIVKESSNGITNADLMLIYKQRFNVGLDYKSYGFEALEECLEDIEGLVPKSVNGVLKIFYASPNVEIMPPRPSPDSRPETKKIYTWTPLKNSESASVIPNYEDSIPYLDHVPNSSDLGNSTKIPSPRNSKIGKDADSKIDDLKRKFKKILVQHPRGIFGRNFISEFEAQYSEELNLEELGYYNLIDLVDDMSDIFTRTQPSECHSDWLLFDADSQIVHKLKAKESDKKTELLSVEYLEKIILNTRKILQVYPEGIFIDEFIHIYSLNTDVQLNVDELGYDTLTSFFMVIKTAVPLKFDYSNVRTRIHLSSNNTGTSFFKSPFPEIPQDAVAPGFKFEVQKLSNENKGKYFEIYTGNIVNPALIYVQLKGEETSDALRKLTDDLENFYGRNISHQYIMQPQHIVVGAVCATVWSVDCTWYRATIASVDMNHVTVIFNDYGNSGKVSKDMLRYLKQEHLKLPAQAIKSRMAFMSANSLDGQWDIKARDRLLEICTDKILMAEIVDSVLCPDVLSLWICDCNGEEDNHLNLLLVKEGFATYTDEKENMTSESNSEELLKAYMTIFKYQSCYQQNNVENTLNYFPVWLNKQLQSQSPNRPIIESPSGMDPNNFMRNPVLNYAQVPNYSLPNQMQNNMYNIGYQNFAYSCMPNYFHQQVPFYPSNIQNPISSTLVNAPTAPQTTNFTPKQVNPPETASVKQTSQPLPPKLLSPIATTEEDNTESDEDELLGEEEDALFYEMCQQHGFVQRYVLRVKLQFGYRIHMIIVEDLPYSTSAEIAQLFWASESGDVLQRRLHHESILLNNTTICDTDFPALFKQLESLSVEGVEQKDGKSFVTLYHFSDLIRILNLFGHPSPTIRSEIHQELQRFDLHDDLWQSFTDLSVEDEEANANDTDSDKFHRMCAHDLKATLEGMKFKKMKLERQLNDNSNPSLQEELEKLGKQCRLFEERITVIEELSHALELPD